MIPQAFYECHHVKSTSLTMALTYCLTFSVIFVLSLYIIVPSNIRILPRNDSRQIKWRFVSVISTSILSTYFYPMCFCQDDETDGLNLPVMAYMGWIKWKSIHFRVLLHTMVLFIGPLFIMLFRAYLKTKSAFANGKNNGKGFISVYLNKLYSGTIRPYLPLCTMVSSQTQNNQTFTFSLLKTSMSAIT